MKHVIEAATDASSLLVYDPMVLPVDFDRRRDEVGALLEPLSRDGKIWWIAAVADGTQFLHAYVGEPVPKELESLASSRETFPRFPVPSGRLVIAGVECAFRDDESSLRRYPGMGGEFVLPQGLYTLTALRVDYLKNHVEDRFRRSIAMGDYLLWSSMRVLIPMAIAAWIGLIVIVFTNVRVPFPGLLAPLLVVVFAIPFVVRGHARYQELKQRYARVERESPAFVVHLERDPASGLTRASAM